MRYAVIENGVVVNVTEGDVAHEDAWVETDTGNIGDSYNPATNTFTPPPPPPENLRD
jgi:hypothetical protein